ncbi:MAG: YhcH/YjgK/YiaL family protein [bacterium]
MILDTLDNAQRYETLHPRFKQAFEWLRSQPLAGLPDGRREIDGDRLYASVMRESGRGQAAARFETHRKYIDIQYLVKGSDLMGWTHLDRGLKSLGYDAAKDLEFYEGIPELWVPVPTGLFAIFFPEDAHAPMAGTTPLHKVVVKVAV